MIAQPTPVIERFRFTVEEFEQMITAEILTEEDRVELIQGEIVAMSPIGDDHVLAVNTLTQLFAHKLFGRAIVSVQNPIRIGEDSRPQPDLAVWRWRTDYVRIPDAADVLLVVEVADTTLAYDRAVKLPLYAAAGIPEVWIINLTERVVEVYREPQPAGYEAARRFTGATDALSPLAFPDVVFVVGDIVSRPH